MFVSQKFVHCEAPPNDHLHSFSILHARPQQITLKHDEKSNWLCMIHDALKETSFSWKAWYERAIEVSRLWKSLIKPAEIPIKNITLWKTRDTDTKRKLGKSSSTRVGAASSFTRVCLCAPISSYTNVFQNDVVSSRRSRSYRRSTSLSGRRDEIPGPISRQGRKIFRGKSLTDDVLMRRFVIEETMMQVRRRNEMEIIRRRCGIRKNKIGPSLLSRMAMAKE